MSTVITKPHDDFAHMIEREAQIVWRPDFDPHAHRYVREVIYQHADRRRGRLRWNGHEVGWSELRPDARRHGMFFVRRVFWLAAHDPYEGRGAPIEAVDPLTLTPGKPGELTERAWGGCVGGHGVNRSTP